MSKELEDFFQRIKDIPNKNNGGCLFFCYLFYLQFCECEIVQYSGWDIYPIQHNLDFIEGRRNRAVSSSHFTWIYSGVEYDSDGPYDFKKDWYYDPDRMILPLVDIDDFCVNALRYGMWNPTFKRKNVIPLIYERFGISMEHVA
jgi:hypothetical protein